MWTRALDLIDVGLAPHVCAQSTFVLRAHSAPEVSSASSMSGTVGTTFGTLRKPAEAFVTVRPTCQDAAPPDPFRALPP